jgi:hypothetical protein
MTVLQPRQHRIVKNMRPCVHASMLCVYLHGLCLYNLQVAMYGMGVNLLLNNVQRAVPAAVGIVLGLIYESNPFDIHSLFQVHI